MDMPFITIKSEKSSYDEEKLDYVLHELHLDDMQIKIAKDRIKGHHYTKEIIDYLEEYLNLVGERVEIANEKMKYINQRLIDICSPILIDGSCVDEDYDWSIYYGHWEELDIEDIFMRFDCLIDKKPAWLDYFTRKELYGGVCKTYMVFEMLKYLYVCDEILEYHIDDDMNLCDDWDYNKKVKVKVK